MVGGAGEGGLELARFAVGLLAPTMAFPQDRVGSILGLEDGDVNRGGKGGRVQCCGQVLALFANFLPRCSDFSPLDGDAKVWTIAFLRDGLEAYVTKTNRWKISGEHLKMVFLRSPLGSPLNRVQRATE